MPADARLTDGALELDLSMLTGESAPVERVAEGSQPDVPPLKRVRTLSSAVRPVWKEKHGPWFSRPACIPNSAHRGAQPANAAGGEPLESQVNGSPGSSPQWRWEWESSSLRSVPQRDFP